MSSITPALGAETVQTAPLPTRVHVHVAPLDGVRGMAILLVLIGHICESVSEYGFYSRILQAGQLGWSGVDLFFVLSGFLITGILLDAKGREGYFKNFYARRALRIFPLYYTAILVVLAVSAIVPWMQLGPKENPLWLFIYMTNFKIAEFGADSFGVLDHFWSLAVEEHYYLVWPSVVFLLGRRALMWVAVAAMAIAFVVRVASIGPEGEMTYFGYMATFARMDALAAGSFIALAARGPNGIAGLARWAGPGVLVFGAAFVALVIWRSTPLYSDPYLGTIGLSLLWALFGCCLVLSLTWKPASAIASAPILRWFGKYSYGMYVWHPIVFILFMHTNWARSWRTGDPWLDMGIGLSLSLAGMFIVSLASWHLMEKRALRLKRYFE